MTPEERAELIIHEIEPTSRIEWVWLVAATIRAEVEEDAKMAAEYWSEGEKVADRIRSRAKP